MDHKNFFSVLFVTFHKRQSWHNISAKYSLVQSKNYMSNFMRTLQGLQQNYWIGRSCNTLALHALHSYDLVGFVSDVFSFCGVSLILTSHTTVLFNWTLRNNVTFNSMTYKLVFSASFRLYRRFSLMFCACMTPRDDRYNMQTLNLTVSY
jgi:hypothetical protein